MLERTKTHWLVFIVCIISRKLKITLFIYQIARKEVPTMTSPLQLESRQIYLWQKKGQRDPFPFALFKF